MPRPSSSPGRLVASPPPLDDYLRVRAGSGLSPRTPEQARGALAHSWSWCHVVEDDGAGGDGEVVAMGRVIGDGGWYFHVADMATLPDHQGRGHGRRVLQHLLAEIAARAPADPYVTLIADPPGRRLYESLGFVDVAPGQTGMARTLHRP